MRILAYYRNKERDIKCVICLLRKRGNFVKAAIKQNVLSYLHAGAAFLISFT